MVQERTSVSSNVIRSFTPNKKPEQTNPDDVLIELTEALEAIDETKPIANLNAVSISDNNGGRIYF